MEPLILNLQLAMKPTIKLNVNMTWDISFEVFQNECHADHQ